MQGRTEIKEFQLSVIRVPSKQSKASVAPGDEWTLWQAEANKCSGVGGGGGHRSSLYSTNEKVSIWADTTII